MKVCLNVAIVNLDVESKFKSLFETVLDFQLAGQIISSICFIIDVAIK